MSAQQRHELVVDGVPAGIEFGARGLVELTQNVRMILTTMIWSVPMDRRFAGDGSVVDTPSPHDVARAMARIGEEVERFEPRVRVVRVEFVPRPVTEHMAGRLCPRVTLHVRREYVDALHAEAQEAVA